MKNKLDEDYLNIIAEIIREGNKKSDRTGTGTYSLFGKTIRHKMSNGFPLLTSKKIFVKGVIEELLWFLRGETNIKSLVDKGVNIWNGDAWKNYQKKTEQSDNPYKTQEEFINALKGKDNGFTNYWGNLGPIYGYQWRRWKTNEIEIYKYEKNEDGSEYPVSKKRSIDQISNLISDLKNNPDSRRLMVNAWNVSELDSMILPPCHYGFQCYTTLLTPEERYGIWFDNNYETGFEYNDSVLPDFDNPYWIPTPTRKLSLMWQQRSVDTFLGLPFNIASYGFLLHMLAQQVNMVPGELIGNLGDTHLYSNHIEHAKEQLFAKTYELPQLSLRKAKDIFSYTIEDFVIENYKHSPAIKAPLSN
jgi:thymidylate synthase